MDTVFVTRGTPDGMETRKAAVKLADPMWLTLVVFPSDMDNESQRSKFLLALDAKGMSGAIKLPVVKNTRASLVASVVRLMSRCPALNDQNFLSYGDTQEQSEERYAKAARYLTERREEEQKAASSGMARINEALPEIAAILQKYGLSIETGCDDSSDTHGISGEHMIIRDTATGTEHRVCDGWGITASDLLKRSDCA